MTIAALPCLVSPILRKHRGLVLALVISTAATSFQWYGSRSLSLTSLPAFDSWVYVTMADSPTFFTVPPWGYRLLAPSIVHWLPLRRPYAFLFLTAVCLITAGGLIFLFLRRLGFRETGSLAAVAAFGLSPPVRASLDNPFLNEPQIAVLVAAFLLAIEAGSGVAVLTLIALAGTLTKEIMPALLPVIWLARRERIGDRRALMETGLVFLPVMALVLILHSWWTPYVSMALPSLGASYFVDLLDFGRQSWLKWLTTLSLGGVTLVAVLGALRKAARPYLRRYGYALAATTLLPLVNPYPYALPFLAWEYSRYLLFALPCILPLCLFALDRLWPLRQPAQRTSGPNRTGERVAVLAVLVILLSPFVLADPYRRADPGVRWGRFVRVFLTDSLETAERLEKGSSVVWEVATTLQEEKRSANHNPLIVRWFLRDGWGESKRAYSDEVVMSDETASFLLPCFTPRDTRVFLTMEASQGASFDVEVNGTPVGVAKHRPARNGYTIRVPAEVLFRGDNLVTLTQQGREELGRPRLRRITLQTIDAPDRTAR